MSKKEVYAVTKLYNDLEKTLNDKKNKKFFLRFIKEITDLDPEDIVFDGIERFNSVSEYDFYWFKFVCTDKGNSKTNIFLKKIQKGTTRETLFCICNLLCEKYLCKEVGSNENFKKITKIKIFKNKQELQDDNTVAINLFGDDLIEKRIKLEIKFIEISKLFEQIKNLTRGWNDLVDLNQNGVLVIGIENNH